MSQYVGRLVGRSVDSCLSKKASTQQPFTANPSTTRDISHRSFSLPSLSGSISTVYTDETRLQSPDHSPGRSRFKFSYDRSTTKDPECRDRFTTGTQFLKLNLPASNDAIHETRRNGSGSDAEYAETRVTTSTDCKRKLF